MPGLWRAVILIPANGDTLILVSHTVVDAILSFQSSKEQEAEAGGILIGRYREPHIEVIECTTPMPCDVRQRSAFDRKDPGHARVARKRWKESGHTLTYVGEWHTHPQAVPEPSSTDLANWAAIMARGNRPLLFFIQGLASEWCALGFRGSLTPCSEVPPIDSEEL